MAIAARNMDIVARAQRTVARAARAAVPLISPRLARAARKMVIQSVATGLIALARPACVAPSMDTVGLVRLTVVLGARVVLVLKREDRDGGNRHLLSS